MNPEISVIIPLYNKERTIANTIEHVLSQNYNDWELIIIDDGSTDNSRMVVEKYLKDQRIKYYYKKNGGPSSARNYGVDKATKEWIVFLDADDFFLNDALCTYSQLIVSNPDMFFFVCNFYTQYNGKYKLYSRKYKNGCLKNNFYAWMFNRCMPRAGACIMHETVCKEFPYNDKIRRYEDADVIFRAMAKYKVYTCRIPVLVYNTDTLEASKSRSNIFEDYLGYIDLKSGNFWARIAKYDLFFRNIRHYPVQVKQMYPQYIKKFYIHIFIMLCRLFNAFENRLYMAFR